MPFRNYITLFFFFNWNCFTQILPSQFVINGLFVNSPSTIDIKILNYRDGVAREISCFKLTNSEFDYVFPEMSEEGIYRLLIITPYKYDFVDFIVSSDETNIQFEYNFKEFKNRINVINSDLNKLVYHHFRKIQKSNFAAKDSLINNKWFTILINTLNFDETLLMSINEDEIIKSASKGEYELLHTPLIETFVQNYIIKTCRINKTSFSLKNQFDTMISKFASNKLFKKCVIRHILIGCKEMNLNDVYDYISDKYDYHID